jgi:protein-S-isoprenylcysteine O-methyltransferase Ste14
VFGKEKGKPVNRTALLLVGATIIAAFAFAATSLAQNVRLTIGLLIGLPALTLIIVSRVQLGKSFSVKPECKALVTAGVYSRIQHPLYFFLDLFLIGVIVSVGWPILLVAWGILVLMHVRQAGKEERVLASGFGAEYEAYRSRTWF